METKSHGRYNRTFEYGLWLHSLSKIDTADCAHFGLLPPLTFTALEVVLMGQVEY